MNAMGKMIAKDFDPEQAGHITVILGRVLALASLIDMLWTNELSKANNPLQEAQDLKEEVLSLVLFDEDDPVQVEAASEMARRLDSILKQVRSL